MSLEALQFQYHLWILGSVGWSVLLVRKCERAKINVPSRHRFSCVFVYQNSPGKLCCVYVKLKYQCFAIFNLPLLGDNKDKHSNRSQ